MGKLTKLRKWFPLLWVGLAVVILVADYFTGPLISISILFLIPVVLAARLSGGWWGIGFGTLMPLAHFGFTFLWNASWTLEDSLINAGIRMAVLVAFAVLIDRMTRQAREIRVLRGLLPDRGPALAAHRVLYYRTFRGQLHPHLLPGVRKAALR